MKLTLLIVSGLVGVLALMLILSRWMDRRGTKAMVEYATTRGWTCLDANHPELLAHLKPAFPKMQWFVKFISAPRSSENNVFLFAYALRSHGPGVDDSRGYACLAKHGGRPVEPTVVVTRRVPLVEKLVDDRVQAGGDEFRRECTVTCSDPEVAARVIQPQVEQLLLEHFKVREWVLDACFYDDKVLVMSFWAQSPEEWDYIVDLTRKLADAAKRRR